MDFRTILAAVAALIAVSGAALAGDWDADKAVCADAIAAEAGLNGQSFAAKLEKARDGATKRLTVKVTPEQGSAVVGECKVRRGEVVEVEMKT
jgi:hypothetical protein